MTHRKYRWKAERDTKRPARLLGVNRVCNQLFKFVDDTWVAAHHLKPVGQSGQGF